VKRVYHRGEKEISLSISQSYGERTYRRRKHQTFLWWKVVIAQTGVEEIATVKTERFLIRAYANQKFFTLFEIRIKRENPEEPKVNISLCSHKIFGRDLFSIWDENYAGKNKYQINEDFRNKVIPNLKKEITENPDKSVFPYLASLDSSINQIFSQLLFLNEYNILPDVARDSTEQLPFAYMRPDGGSVSEVIHVLKNEHFHKIEDLRYYSLSDLFGYYSMPLSYSRYFNPLYYYRRYRPYRRSSNLSGIETALEHINKELSAAVKPIFEVGVQIDPTNGKRFVIFQTKEGEVFYPQEVSDGTIKWLCILVSIFVPYSTVYLLEEPENFLHPWMQQRLIQIMREHAQKNKTIYILTSHSSTILNAATLDEVLIVQQKEKGTEINEILDKNEIEDVLQNSDFGLGDLWVSGAIGGLPSDE
jgi:hypothetical protein